MQGPENRHQEASVEPVPLLALSGLTRSYDGVQALAGVDLDLHAGRIHALVGENGAGKSTLIGILAGTVRPDAGVLRWSPRCAGRIAVVYQHSHLLPHLTIAENLAVRHGYPRTALGSIDWRRLSEDCDRVLREFSDGIAPEVDAAALGTVERQLVEIALTLADREDEGADVVVLDEPTAVLPVAESAQLLAHLRSLREAGRAVIFTSHRLDEVLAIADDVTVLRDGHVVYQGSVDGPDEAGLVRLMCGVHGDPVPTVTQRRQDEITARFLRGADPGAGVHGDPAALIVQDLRIGDGVPLSLRVEAGEIVGVYGLAGAGQEELCEVLLGLRQGTAAVLSVGDRDLQGLSPSARVSAGLSVLPSDRIDRGLLYDLDIRENLSLANLSAESGLAGWLDLDADKGIATSQMTDLDVRARGPLQPVGELSGGNQQKVLLGRWLRPRPRLLVLHEPTQGVDVAAKAQIHEHIQRLAAGGVGILLVSGDLKEVLGLGQRVAVLRDGAIAGQLPVDPEAAGVLSETEEQILRLALPHKATAGDHAPEGARRKRHLRGDGRQIGLAITVASLVLVAAATTPAFRQPTNLLDLLVNHTILLVGALAAAVVIIAGSIDISLGAVLALAAVAAAQADNAGAPAPLIALAALLTGGFLGWLNGALSVWGRVHAIVITLGTLSLYRGALLQWTGGRWLVNLSPELTLFGQSSPAGIPAPLLVAAGAALGTLIFLRHLPAGRRLYTIGSDRARAAVSGIHAGRVLPMAFAIAGLLAGLAGLLQAARYGQVQSNTGIGFELKAIAAAVIGGVHIAGGRGGVGGVVLGTLLLALVANLLVLWHVSVYWEGVVVGAALLGVLATDGVLRRKC